MGSVEGGDCTGVGWERARQDKEGELFLCRLDCRRNLV